MSRYSSLWTPITVADVEASIPFYRDALGLELTLDVPAGPHRWVTFTLPGTETSVVISDAGAGRPGPDGEALAALIAKGTGPGPYVLGTDDLDAVFEQAKAAGAEVLQEPADQPWGPRDCAFRDPSGNTIRVQARPAASPSAE